MSFATLSSFVVTMGIAGSMYSGFAFLGNPILRIHTICFACGSILFVWYSVASTLPPSVRHAVMNILGLALWYSSFCFSLLKEESLHILLSLTTYTRSLLISLQAKKLLLRSHSAHCQFLQFLCCSFNAVFISQ